jgi:hypothetical protein
MGNLIEALQMIIKEQGAASIGIDCIHPPVKECRNNLKNAHRKPGGRFRCCQDCLLQ